MLLTHSQARQIAETLWGRGGTSSIKTNASGAFYFSCSGHGGFVIDAATLTADEIQNLSQHSTPYSATRYVYGSKVKMLWEGSRKSIRVPHEHTKEKFKFFVLEEDCAWALAYMFTQIRLKSPSDRLAIDEQEAKDTYWNWFDKNNPAVAARANADILRNEKDPDLIVSAIIHDAAQNITKVYTADGAPHFVTHYDRAFDEFGTPWLSRCSRIPGTVAG